MIKLTKQIINPNKILVRIKGESKEEIKGVFYKFINYGPAVSMKDCYFDEYEKGVEIEDFTGFNFLNDHLFNDGYFRSTQPTLLQTCQSIKLFEILRIKDPQYELVEIPQSFEIEANKQGEIWFNSIPDEDILNCVDRETKIFQYTGIQI